MLITLILLNRFLLDDFYTYNSYQEMEKFTTHFVANYEGIYDEERMMHLVRETGSEVTLIDENLKSLIGPMRGEVDLEINKIISGMIAETKIKDKAIFKVIGEGNYQTQRIVYLKAMDDGNYLLISKGMGLLTEFEEIFIIFLIIASILVYFFGFFMVYWYANYFTKPIIKLKETAEKIAALEFDQRNEVTSDDEIGELTRSVNKMALELSSNIQALNESNRRLENELLKEKNLDKMRRRFVADVSHELKNPISMIMGYAEGIVRGLPKSEEDKAYYANVILEEGAKMDQLVKNLLELSRFNMGQQSLAFEDVNLSELLRSSVDKFQVMEASKICRVEVEIEDKCWIIGDAFRLRQVMINLIDNAFKYTEDNGFIKIDLKKTQEKAIITIANTGNLIPPEALEEIWLSFYQVDTHTEGSGLGLAIVKSIVELHNGIISAFVKNDMNYFEVRLNL